MSGPIILGSLSFTIMQFVDQILVASLGTDALAAIGSAGVWSYVMGCFIFGVTGCVSTFVAQCYGRGIYHQCARYAWQGIYLSSIGGVLALILLPLSGPLFHCMDHTPEVTRLELIFFRIRIFGYIFMAWEISLTSFFQGIGRPIIPMIIGILANVINLIANNILIFGRFGFPKLGIAGSATATCIALACQVAMLQYVFMSKPFNDRFQTRTGWTFDFTKITDLFRVGVFAGITIFMDVANWAIFTSFIVGHFGPIAMASHNAAVSFMHLCFMPALGLNQGLAAIVGRYIGKDDIPTAITRTYTGMRVAMVYMVCLGLIFAILGKILIGLLFSDDPEVLRLGHILLCMAAIFQAFDAINVTLLGALRGAGDTRWVAIITSLCAYGFFLPLSLILAFLAGWGTVGAWIGATSYIIGLSLILLQRFRNGEWQSIRIFSQPDETLEPAIETSAP